VLGTIVWAVLASQAAQAQEPADAEIVLATTTSVRDAGLLEHVLPLFESATGYRVKVIAVGSGQALALGRKGEADILIVHDPAAERTFMTGGFGVERVPLMSNEFVVVGPGRDDARIRGLSAVEAFRTIALTGSRFVSRADRSGTHTKEALIWSLAGIAPNGAWYLESGQGMSATLQIANELAAYVLTDIATLFTHKSPLSLEILVQRDSLLDNPYHVLVPSRERFPWLNVQGATRLRTYLQSASVQQAIAAYRRQASGRSLFMPAVPAERQM